jgi:hypothetical protein
MCGVRQRIPTLNLILNPKLNLIPKLITVATELLQLSCYNARAVLWPGAQPSEGDCGVILAFVRPDFRVCTKLLLAVAAAAR